MPIGSFGSQIPFTMSSPPVYSVLCRRSLRRPALILTGFLLFVFLMRNLVVFDAQHSTSIAFKLGRKREPATTTIWATRTIPRVEAAISHPQKRSRSRPAKASQHTYHPNGLLIVNPTSPHPIHQLTARAEAAWASKVARASTTLRQAAAEYTRRYARLPPRGFDMWWAYACVNAVQLPDEYDQIDRDLAPFYGVEPVALQKIQRDWEAHRDSYTLGKDAQDDPIRMVNFTLPADEDVRRELGLGGFQIIELMKDVEREIPPFRAVFSPHDSPNLFVDYELKQRALDAASKGEYIDLANPLPAKHGWLAACPPSSPAHLHAIPPPFDDANPNTEQPNVPDDSSTPKTFIHAHLPAMDPCLHPTHFTSHGAYLSHGAGPTAQRSLVPQFSYSSTPVNADIRFALPLNWVPDDFPHEGRPPPSGLTWQARTDERVQWRGSNTGIWHAADGRWRESHRVRLAALGAGMGSEKVEVLSGQDSPAIAVNPVSRSRYIPALLDIAFTGKPMNCLPAQCDELRSLFEWRAAHDLKKAGRYKYVLDVDGNGWSSRFKRLMNSGSVILKATGYPEWFTDRIAPWVHYVPIQNSYTDLLDVLVFFRGDPAGQGAHDEMAERIARQGREWSRQYWRREDLVAYNYRLFLEYARVMSTDRKRMSFVIWEDASQDEAREEELKRRWIRRMNDADEEEADMVARKY
ncbi:glycosyl transferase family 90-domain-containing protein [Roridomyces roridus]|uniref:Glycosyl transferase family 90-domain-containing protein n=1 Tax=Roridomyces roridus TaxID=1738132 RepID=A0AAD7BHD9_9AGAR|nr:glycosyl transferase family 90-domain-containing protein [Roridomyces roridus]